MYLQNATIFVSNKVTIVFQYYCFSIFILIFSSNKITKITLLVCSLSFFSFKTQTKEVNTFTDVSLFFRIFICCIIKKDQ